MLKIKALLLALVMGLAAVSYCYENNQAAEVVIGQANMTDNVVGLSADRMSLVNQVSTDGTKLFLTDLGDCRVLVFNAIPVTNSASADVVIGQPNMTTGGLGLLNNPYSAMNIGSKFFIADFNHNRVLLFDTVPAANNPAPDHVLGQPDFSTTSAGVGPGKFYRPEFMTSDGTHLILSDTFNNRVLIYNSIPSVSGAPADIVVGQTDLFSSAAGCAANKLNLPYGVKLANGKLLIADNGNNRILVFNSLPTTHNASADVVIGQTVFSINTPGCSAAKLNTPSDVFVDAFSHLFICDTSNHRVVMFGSVPGVSGMAADLVLGQPDFTSGSAGCSARQFNNPTSVSGFGHKLFISDYNNKRALVFVDHFAVNTLAPTQGIAGSQVFLTLAGMGFDPGMSIKLCSGGTTVTATMVNAANSNTATCMVDLSVAPGNYDVVAERAGFPPAVLLNGFGVMTAATITATATETMTATATPTASATETATVTAAFLDTPTFTPTVPNRINTSEPVPADFFGKVISKNYVYAAPNPVRGSMAKIHVLCRQPAQVEIKLLTLAGEPVLTRRRSCRAGDNLEEVNLGGLPNAGYYVCIKARGDDGAEENVKVKLYLLK